MAALLALTGLAAACVPEIQEPDVRVAGARLGGLGLQGGVVYVRLSVVNPNDFALEAEWLSYDLDLNDPAAGDDGWVDFATDTFTEAMQVPANDSTIVEIPVEFNYGAVGGVIRSVLATGTVEYRLRGTVAVAEPLRVEVPFRRRGTVSMAGSD